ncbi:pituitary homeobox 3-like [Haliotis rufescens]|uniref:pituitary homeobox 3-like n=1 Tax=Haliotis rufescens TaxID=6454 RepID=UPI00201F424F|nr:pituitary homeobox 3-like [Haliotis rufescens]
MATRQESFPFSISSLMKTNPQVAHDRVLSPGCLAGSLAAIMPRDYQRADPGTHQYHHSEHDLQTMICTRSSEVIPSQEQDHNESYASPEPSPKLETPLPPSKPLTTGSPSPSPVNLCHHRPDSSQYKTCVNVSEQRVHSPHAPVHAYHPYLLESLTEVRASPLTACHPQDKLTSRSRLTTEKFGSCPKTERMSTPSKTDIGDKCPISPKRSRSRSKSSRCSVSSTDSDQPQRRGSRISYTSNQIQRLDAVFLVTPYPETQLYEKLEEELGVPQRNLKTWFQNKRARTKRQKAAQPHQADKSPVHSFLMPPCPAMSSALPQFSYMMPGAMVTAPLAVPTSSSAMMTPPSSPSPSQLIQRPCPVYLGTTTSSAVTTLGQVSPPFGISSRPGTVSIMTPSSGQISPQMIAVKNKRFSLSRSSLSHEPTSGSESWNSSGSQSKESFSPSYLSTLSALETLYSSLPFSQPIHEPSHDEVLSHGYY